MDVTIIQDSEGLPVPVLMLEPIEREHLLGAHSALMHDLSAAHRWFDDPDVPVKDKEDRWLTLFNMRDRQAFLYKLLRSANVPDTQIMKDLDLPF